MNAETKPRRIAGLSTREIPDDETVLVAPSGKAIVVNAMASVVVSLANGKRTLDEISREIHGAVQGATLEQVQADVERIVTELIRVGCLET
jgi:hypothetical protein